VAPTLHHKPHRRFVRRVSWQISDAVRNASRCTYLQPRRLQCEGVYARECFPEIEKKSFMLTSSHSFMFLSQFIACLYKAKLNAHKTYLSPIFLSLSFSLSLSLSSLIKIKYINLLKKFMVVQLIRNKNMQASKYYSIQILRLKICRITVHRLCYCPCIYCMFSLCKYQLALILFSRLVLAYIRAY